VPVEERPSGTLSVGNRQRLNVALSLLGEPEALLLDEPTAALDPGQRRRVWDVVQGVRAAGGAVCFATQNLEELEQVADRVLVLRAGEVVFSGTPRGYEQSELEVFH
jgi:ABC-2 type transport system ATP-binding protein